MKSLIIAIALIMALPVFADPTPSPPPPKLTDGTLPAPPPKLTAA